MPSAPVGCIWNPDTPIYAVVSLEVVDHFRSRIACGGNYDGQTQVVLLEGQRNLSLQEETCKCVCVCVCLSVLDLGEA